MGLFYIECSQLNQYLAQTTVELENQIVLDQLEKNRDLNRQVNRDYEEIGRKLSKEPNNTEELVDTIAYLKNVVKVEKDALSKRVQAWFYINDFK